jgi:hypothetical protein
MVSAVVLIAACTLVSLVLLLSSGATSNDPATRKAFRSYPDLKRLVALFRACSLAMGAYARSIAANLIGAPPATPGMIEENVGAALVRAHAQMLTLRTAEIAHS